MTRVRLGRDDVRRIAALARLDPADPVLDGFAAQLASVLEHVAALEDAIDAPAEDADASPASALRDDVPGADRLTAPPPDFAPAFSEGFFTVPRLAPFEPGARAAAPDG